MVGLLPADIQRLPQTVLGFAYRQTRIVKNIEYLICILIDARLSLVEQLANLAVDAGTSLSQLALAWVCGQPGVTAPIAGPRTMAHLEDNLAALSVEIPEEVLGEIDALIPPGSEA